MDRTAVPLPLRRALLGVLLLASWPVPGAADVSHPGSGPGGARQSSRRQVIFRRPGPKRARGSG